MEAVRGLLTHLTVAMAAREAHGVARETRGTLRPCLM